MDALIQDVTLTPLRIIPGESGSVYHALKNLEDSYTEFGEAYFSTVNKGAVKGWKLHTRMHSNLIVPVGAIRFVLFDNRDGSESKGRIMDLTLSLENYQRLTVPPGIWMAFQGMSDGLNMLLNISSIPHDPAEAEQLPVENTVIPPIQWR